MLASVQFPELAMTMLWKWLPAGLVAAGCAIAIFLAHYWLFRREGALLSEDRLRRQLIIILLCAAAVVAVILALPLSETTRGQLLALLGLLLSAAIALSSTTLIGNAMAGIMLRAVGNFRLGDFVQTGEHFGRVSERGLFHVEIQTEDRDLTTLPNLYLISNPMKVVRSSGTIVSAHVSLGYDVPRAQIEGLLLEAAQTAGLAEPFVQIFELGDFSVTYRAAGLLQEVKELLPARSRLRAAMLDTLHRSGIEIVSPSFMNQRALPPEKVFIPEPAPSVPVGSGAPMHLRNGSCSIRRRRRNQERPCVSSSSRSRNESRVSRNSAPLFRSMNESVWIKRSPDSRGTGSESRRFWGRRRRPTPHRRPS
jgi:small-conductance mechanosensitive channel